MSHYDDFDKDAFSHVLKHKFILHPGFNIYNGSAGLIDLGPIACGVRKRIIEHWRRRFVETESVFEIDSSILTKEEPLRASGHVQKFCDYVADDENGVPVRLDHYFEELLGEAMNDMRLEDYTRLIELHNTKLSNPREFNLMFKTQSCTEVLYLRPETAQGHFVNFMNLYKFNNSRLPFGSAMVGLSFRNEISPRNMLLRTREFCMAELEYFTAPGSRTHKDYPRVAHVQVSWNNRGESGSGSIEELNRIINNEIVSYFIGTSQLFAEELGLHRDCIRFRRHMPNEMAHYAADCWDMELYCSTGWVECAGIADRGTYDLTQHSNCSREELRVRSDEKKLTTVYTMEYDKRKLASKLGPKSGAVFSALSRLSQEKLRDLKEVNATTCEVEGESVEIQIRSEEKMVAESFIPRVVEPSFGINRILQVVLEHTFKSRDQERTYFSFNHRITWRHGVIVTLCKSNDYVFKIQELLRTEGVCFETDLSSASIGKKYARNDEIGIPYMITIDNETLAKEIVTLRFRDTMEQVCLQTKELGAVVKELINGLSWEECMKRYPKRNTEEKSE